MSYQSGVAKNDFSSEARDFFSGRRVSVLGGSGFIGSHVVEQLLTLGALPVVGTRQTDPQFLRHVRDAIELRQCDILAKDEAIAAMEGCSAVLNMSAVVGGIEFNAKHPASIFQENLIGFMNVIAGARELGVERFLVTSSACVYPRFCSIPTPEEEGFKDAPEPTNAGYGWAKRMEEFLGKAYADEFGMSVAIARPYNAYGPRDNFSYAKSHVIPALIRRAWECTEDRFEVWGDGSHSRSFLYVDDFARGLIEVAACYPKADAINLGNSEEVTIKELAEAIGDIVSQEKGREIRPYFNDRGLTGQPRRCCDVRRASAELGYTANVPFKVGLKETVGWYARNADRIVYSDEE